MINMRRTESIGYRVAEEEAIGLDGERGREVGEQEQRGKRVS